jgi:hypothetical protein
MLKSSRSYFVTKGPNFPIWLCDPPFVVELARLIFWFGFAGLILAQFIVWLSQLLFCLSGGREIVLLGSWGFFVWLSPFFCLSSGRGGMLLSSHVVLTFLFRDGLAQ